MCQNYIFAKPINVVVAAGQRLNNFDNKSNTAIQY